MDCSKLIAELISVADMTQIEIAEQVGISQPHVSDLLNKRRGKRGLNYEAGSALRDLYRRRVLPRLRAREKSRQAQRQEKRARAGGA